MARQSPQLRAQLDAAWQAHPRVRQHEAAIRAFAVEHDLAFDPAGMTAVLTFAAREIETNGRLPDSGILIG